MPCEKESLKGFYLKQEESFQCLLDSINHFYNKFITIDDLDSDLLCLVIKELALNVRGAYSDLQNFRHQVMGNVIEIHLTELEHWMYKLERVIEDTLLCTLKEIIGKFMKKYPDSFLFSKRDVVKMVTAWILDAKAATRHEHCHKVLCGLHHLLHRYYLLLKRICFQLRRRTTEDFIFVLEQRTICLGQHECLGKQNIKELRNDVEKLGALSEQQIQERKDKQLKKLDDEFLKNAVLSFWQDRWALAQHLRDNGRPEADLVRCICMSNYLAELHELTEGNTAAADEEHPEDKRTRFLKIVITEIQKVLWKDEEPLVKTTVHWFYVFRFLAEKKLFTEADYQGFCNFLESVGVQPCPSAGGIKQEAFNFLSGQFPQWKFARPNSDTAKRKMEIGLQMNLLYKKYSYMLK